MPSSDDDADMAHARLIMAQIELEATKSDLQEVRARLADAEDLSVALEKHALAMDRNLLEAKEASHRLEREVKELKSSAKNGLDEKGDNQTPNEKFLKPVTISKNGNYLCGLCQYNQPGSKRFQAHIDMCHVGYLPFACDEMNCHDSFVTYRELREHFNGHCEVVDCIANMESSNITTATSTCPQAANQTASQPSETVNVYKRVKIRGGIYHCGLCSYKEPGSEQFQEHIALKHRGYLPFKCNVDGCERTFRRFAELRTHNYGHRLKSSKIMGYTIVFTPEDGGNVDAPIASQMKPPLINISSNSNVASSENSTMFVTNLRTNFQLLGSSSSSSSPKTSKPVLVRNAIYYCGLCPFNSHCVESFHIHTTELHPDNLPFKCDDDNCNKSFQRLDQLNSHKHDFNMFKCKNCSFETRSEEMLITHCNEDHPVIKESKCDKGAIVKKVRFSLPSQSSDSREEMAQ